MQSWSKKERGQMPFLTERAVNYTDYVKTGIYRKNRPVSQKNHTDIKNRPVSQKIQEKHKDKDIRKNDKVMAYFSLPPRTQPVLSLFPFKVPILCKWFSNTALLVSMLFSLTRNMWLCAIAMTSAAITVVELPPPAQLLTIVLCIMCASVKTACLIGSRETSHCP